MEKLTAPMEAALRSARDHGNPTYHLRGQSDWGGWTGTRAALIKRGLLNVQGDMTNAGITAAANLK